MLFPLFRWPIKKLIYQQEKKRKRKREKKAMIMAKHLKYLSSCDNPKIECTE